MAALSSQDVRRFTPAHYKGRDDAPVYLLGALAFRARARFRAAIASEGIRIPNDAEVARAAIQVIRDLNPDNADELVSNAEAFLELLDCGKPPEPPAEGADAAAKAAYDEEIARRVAIAQPYDKLVDVLRQHPQIGRLLGLRTLFNELAAPIAAIYGLIGWENGPGAFRRVDGVVPDDVLELLPDEDLVAIGGEVLGMMAVSKAQRGNFASPSPSAGGQGTSTDS